MRQYLAAVILLVILVGLFILPRDTLRRALGTVNPAPAVSTTTTTTTSDATALLQLRYQEDQALLAAYPSSTFAGSARGIVVPVYAAYPFNYEHALLVGGGKAAGVTVGDTAVLRAASTSSGATFIGTVTDVFPTTARVRTIFDPSWKSAVRIGTSSVDALLVGGIAPRLTLIPKTAAPEPDASVWNADQRFPYGLNVGTAGDRENASGGVFQEALLRIPYDVAAVRTLIILPHAQ